MFRRRRKDIFREKVWKRAECINNLDLSRPGTHLFLEYAANALDIEKLLKTENSRIFLHPLTLFIYF